MFSYFQCYFNMEALQDFLDRKAEEYNRPNFIQDDPILIPHRFQQSADIEIAGLFAALLAWGNRTSIINSCEKLMQLMQGRPHAFVLEAPWEKSSDVYLELSRFVHRTFNGNDLLHLLRFLHHHYAVLGNPSLENAFSKWLPIGAANTEQALSGFHEYVFSFDDMAKEERHCRKHVATPVKKSACKRLNMYLRWMVRQDEMGVDFGLWKEIGMSQLVCPLDVHVVRVARRFGLLSRKPTDWQSALELTAYLKTLDPNDPVKYDFALFGLGVIEHY